MNKGRLPRRRDPDGSTEGALLHPASAARGGAIRQIISMKQATIQSRCPEFTSAVDFIGEVCYNDGYGKKRPRSGRIKR